MDHFRVFHSLSGQQRWESRGRLRLPQAATTTLSQRCWNSSVNIPPKNNDRQELDVDFKDLGLKDKLMLLWERYGMVTVVTYLSTYLTTLSGLYFALDNDLLLANSLGFDPVTSVQRVCDLFETITGSNMLPGLIRDEPRYGTFAVAWLITKFTEPARAVATIFLVPSISRAIGRAPKKIKKPKKAAK